MNDRRSFFARVASLSAGLWMGSKVSAQHEHHGMEMPMKAPAKAPAAGSMKESMAAKGPGVSVTPMSMEHMHHMAAAEFVTPDLPKLPWTMVDGVKEFHLVAEVVKTQLTPERAMSAWGYNGSIPGPTIEVNEGERFRVVFENRLPEMTAVHWHGFEVPMTMDGSVGLGQDPTPPGGKFVYDFTLNQHGTLFYHSHFPMQEMMGMIGFVIVHPKVAYEPRVDRDFGLVLQEWALLPNNDVPNTLSMEYNWLTFNGKGGPACTPMIVKQGERVRIRLVNLGMDHHPIHMHGHQFTVTATEANRKPAHTWFEENTVIVGVAQARVIEFEAKHIGDWMVHCHLPHHMMNQMASMVGPMSHGGQGMHTGGGMQEGMGMLQQGDAMAESFGPTLGRGLGLAADAERSTSNLVANQGVHTGNEGHVTAPGDPLEAYPKDDPAKKKVAGYPQDMWMMMDEMYNDKPENYGLRKGWTASMMGMMTLVRVVDEAMYQKIEALRAAQSNSPAKPMVPTHVHQHD